jgi:mannose-6-phosphate isomerase
MKSPLGPIRFEAIPKTKLWGGKHLAHFPGKAFDASLNIGESWEISAVPDAISIVSEGFHQGKTLNQLIDEFGAELLGERIAQKYGNQFPLLIKLLDAQEDLSVQVHPDDYQAKGMGLGSGKTEMWHILHAEPGAKLNIGFKENVSIAQIEQAIKEHSLMQLLHILEVKAGDSFYIPAGTIHFIGKGIVLAEIQQSSDTTFRVYDFDRLDAAGHARELHVDQALKVMHTKSYDSDKSVYHPSASANGHLVSCPYFQTYLYKKVDPIALALSPQGSFKIIMCISGNGILKHGTESYTFGLGSTLFLPASIQEVRIEPQGPLSWLEIEAI